MAVVSLEAQAPPPTSGGRLDLNMDYVRTIPGMLRIAQAVLCLAAIICIAQGYCYNDTGRYGFILFIIVLTMIKAALILIMFLLKLNEKITAVNVTLSLLLNDGIVLIFFFFTSTLALLAIGGCEFSKAARTIGALFILCIFFVLVGLNYFNYLQWEKEKSAKDSAGQNGSMTVTETSPTVLT